MRRAAALLAACLLAACDVEPEAEPVCPHEIGYDRSRFVRVIAGAPPAAMRRDLDVPELARESGGLAGEGRPQGLTKVANQLRFVSSVKFRRSNGRYCVWLEDVEIDLTPSSIEIFIPREYANGSCEYEAILAHESEHVRVHRERLTEAAVRVERALEDAKWLPARGNPVMTTNQKAVEATLKAKIRKVVTPVYASYRADLEAAQAELDRPDLYHWVSKRCAGWK